MEPDKGRFGMNKRILSTLISICILFLIVCIEARTGSLSINDEISIPVQSNILGVYNDSELNENEKIVLDLLTGINLGNRPLIEKNPDYKLYVEYLKAKFSTSEIDLSVSEADQIIDKIIDMNKIMNLEHEGSINNMSLDGRELSIKLSEQIYGLCGLDLIYDVQGNINLISEQSGDIIYINENYNRQKGFQINALMITLLIMIILFGICVIIAKKNQLLKKGGIYDGFNEEGFAQ